MRSVRLGAAIGLSPHRVGVSVVLRSRKRGSD